MALSSLRLDESNSRGHFLVLDTGTSTHFRLHLGKEVRHEQGFVLLDGPYWSSPLRVNANAGKHIDTRFRFVLDPALVTESGTFVQLESCRGPDGRGAAWSVPVRLPGFTRVPATRPIPRGRVRAMSIPDLVGPGATSSQFAAPRIAPLRSAQETFSRPASVSDLISQVVQAAAPIVMNMLNQPPGSTSQPNTDPAAALLSNVLRTVLGALSQPPTSATAPTTPATTSAATPATPPAATPSVPAAPVVAPVGTAEGAAAPVRMASVEMAQVNRFLPPGSRSEPMIFGIDDALIGALAGPVLANVAGPLIQLLPQLLNSANQAKIAREAQTNQHISNLLSQADRSLLMRQAIAAQNMPVNPGVTSSDLEALANLLQAFASAPSPTGTQAPLARAASIETPRKSVPTASKAALTAVCGPAVTRLGAPRVCFAREQATTFRFRLDVGAAGPKVALSRAILTICIREPGAAQSVLERSVRLTDLLPGSEIKVALTGDETRALPVDADLEVLASLRWKTPARTYQASCSRIVVLTSRAQVKSRGELVGDPVELVDMNRFRSFWNKVWSSPTTGDDGAPLPLWRAELALRYSVVLVAGDRANGLMESRLQAGPAESGLRVKVMGRLKSGIEVSVQELNKLLPLWPGEQPLAPTDLAAFGVKGWLAGQGGDTVHQVKMEGRKGRNGLVWVVPVVRLRTFTLADGVEVDPYGQIVATRDRDVRFPVIESVRFLGLTSTREPGDAGDEAEGTAYRFDGYDVTVNALAGLEPAAPIPKPRSAVHG